MKPQPAIVLRCVWHFHWKLTTRSNVDCCDTAGHMCHLILHLSSMRPLSMSWSTRGKWLLFKVVLKINPWAKTKKCSRMWPKVPMHLKEKMHPNMKVHQLLKMHQLLKVLRKERSHHWSTGGTLVVESQQRWNNNLIWSTIFCEQIWFFQGLHWSLQGTLPPQAVKRPWEEEARSHFRRCRPSWEWVSSSCICAHI